MWATLVAKRVAGCWRWQTGRWRDITGRQPLTYLIWEQIVAVAIEFLNMIIPVAEIEKKYPGGWEQCREDTGCDMPGNTSWSDGQLLRLGTMSEMTLQLMGDEWASMGFKGFFGRGDKKRWRDFCQFGSLTGPILCDWLSFDEKSGTVSFVKKVRP